MLVPQYAHLLKSILSDSDSNSVDFLINLGDDPKCQYSALYYAAQAESRIPETSQDPMCHERINYICCLDPS